MSTKHKINEGFLKFTTLFTDESGKPTKWMWRLLFLFGLLSIVTYLCISGQIYSWITGVDLNEFEAPVEYVGVVDVVDGDSNVIEDFVYSISDELSSYGVDMSEFRLLDYSYNTDNKVIYRLNTSTGDVAQLWIHYNEFEVLEYNIHLDSETVEIGEEGAE